MDITSLTRLAGAAVLVAGTLCGAASASPGTARRPEPAAPVIAAAIDVTVEGAKTRLTVTL